MIKTAQVANLNITFGEGELPLLEFFDTVFYPAITSGISRKSYDDYYMFKEIEISKNNSGVYILRGKLVKKTTLEIKSDLNEYGELIDKDEQYSAAPYSYFIINLKNHRLVFMPNQKGSPTLANFKSTIAYVIETYINNINNHRDEKNKIDSPMIRVVGVPSVKSMSELLENVEKIQLLRLKFYPLNGDIDYSEAFGILTNNTRRTLDCKNGEILFRSPKSIDGVIEVLEKAGGTICPVLKVKTKNGSTATLNDYQLSERYEFEMGDDPACDDGIHLTQKAEEIPTMNYTNDSHNKIYEQNISRIIPFFPKRCDK